MISASFKRGLKMNHEYNVNKYITVEVKSITRESIAKDAKADKDARDYFVKMIQNTGVKVNTPKD
jgi:hypothetical protein